MTPDTHDSAAETLGAARPRFSFSDAVDDGVRVLAVTGEIDLASAPELERCLSAERDGGIDAVVIDLTHVSFLDSAGVRLLVSELHRCQAAGQAFGVVPGNEANLRLLNTVGVAGHIRMLESPQDVRD
jgi:anti-anti-sigma factor